MAAMIIGEGIYKSYDEEVLHGVDISVMEHELTLITGPSGSGKTTLLNILGGIERPDAGTVLHGEIDITTLAPEALTRWRGERLGLAFQHARLMSNLTVLENITMPMQLRGEPIVRETAAWGDHLCRTLGISDLLGRAVTGLSGGQKQRVAFARALIHQPEMLIADEPTAALDGQTKVEIHELMRGLVDEEGASILMVSHDTLSSDYADTIVRLQDGALSTGIRRK